MTIMDYVKNKKIKKLFDLDHGYGVNMGVTQKGNMDDEEDTFEISSQSIIGLVT